MKVIVLAVGKCRDKAILSLCDEYCKRLKAFWPTEVAEVTAKTSSSEAEYAEIEKYLAKVKAQNAGGLRIIALDERGKQFSSRNFSQKLTHFFETGCQTMVFIIGGADGHTDTLRSQADLLLGLSKFTLPHMLVRPVLLEQIYRAATIKENHPYHRD
jgi:23S rRNA (pseudouridine1915-N3)-methyltransferase